MDWMGQALANVFSATDLLVMVAGVAGGILVGALPGLTGTMAIALLVPFTYGLAPDAALVMLGGVYVGAMYGGSIAVIHFREVFQQFRHLWHMGLLMVSSSF